MGIQAVSKIELPVRTATIAPDATVELDRFDSTLVQYRVVMEVGSNLHTFQLVCTENSDYTIHALVGPALDFDFIPGIDAPYVTISFKNNEASDMICRVIEIESL